MKKVVLLNPYYSQKSSHHFYKPTPPIGLMYLSSYLKKYGGSDLDIKIFELGVFDKKEVLELNGTHRYGKSDAEIVEYLEKEKPDVVGLSCMYSVYYHDVVKIARVVKACDKNIKIVVGGNHASSYWEGVLRNKDVDIVIIGEGEQTFLEYCQDKDISTIRGVCFRDSQGKSIKNEPRGQMDINKIPMPDYEGVKLEKYLTNASVFSMRNVNLGIVSSRGCPAKCKFCTIKAVWGRDWRGTGPSMFVDEIEYLVNRYGVTEFCLLDDSASVDKERWNNLSDEIVRRKMKIKWSTPNGIAHWTLDEECLDKMKAAGCYRVTFGIESGNKRIRKYMGKPGSLERATRMIKHANKIGMWTICTHIIGFPDETYEEMLDTLNYAKTCGTDFATFYLLIPQPTADVYDDFKRLGLLDLDEFFDTDSFNTEKFTEINEVLNETGCKTLHMTKEQLSQTQKDFYRKFMIHRGLSYVANPFKILRKIRSREELGYVMRLGKEAFKIFKRTLSEHNNRTGDYLYEK